MTLRLRVESLEVVSSPDDLSAHAWRRPDAPARSSRDEIVSSSPLGDEHDARAFLALAWPAEHGAIASDTEVLLELLVDLVIQTLVRVRSPLAPAPGKLEARPVSTKPPPEVLLGSPRSS